MRNSKAKRKVPARFLPLPFFHGSMYLVSVERTIIPYIPFSCALLQKVAPVDHDSGMKIHHQFIPSWFTARSELRFDEPWHTDPGYRYRSFVQMAELVNEAFPDLKLGGDVSQIKGSISGVQSCSLPAAFFGQKIIYDPGGWPDNEGALLTDRQTEELEVPDFRSHPAFENLMLQMDQIEREWGVVEGELNFQSVMNTAFRLRGTHLYLDMYDNPERVHHLFDVIYHMLVDLIEEVHGRQTRSGAERSFFITANCVVNMISRQHYEQFLMPLDKRLSEHFPHFGIHNCNWSVNEYIPSYAEIGGLLYLDFGMESDLVRLKRTFPDTTLTVFYRLTGKEPREVVADLDVIRRSDSCSRIYLSAIGADTPSSLVLHFFDTASRLWNKPIREMLCEPPSY
jgi:hypothetical protein